MSITLNAIEIRHERRIRLIFSRPLDAGAFGAPSPGFYTIENQDSLGLSPTVTAAMIVAGSPAVVELNLNVDIVQGALYNVTADGVPGDDASVTPPDSTLPFRYGRNATKRDVEPLERNRDGLLYGVDLLWNGADYQETANGDLDRVSGTANVTKALYRGLEAHGLTWDQSYGARLRNFVDSPSSTSGTMKGAVTAQALRDPRVKKVKVEVVTEDYKTYLKITPTLVTGAILSPVTMVVPSS